MADQGKQDLFDSEEQSIVDTIDDFAAKGFRTLFFGIKELQSPEIDGVLTQDDIESCLNLVGATCVEDLLQKDVKQCLVDFKRAGI